MELLGRKGREYFIKRPVKVSGELTWASARTAGLAEAAPLAKKIIQRFSNGEVDSVYILYNEFKSILTQKVTLKPLLPMAVEAGAGPTRDYIFEQPPAEMLGSLLPQLCGAAGARSVAGIGRGRTCRAHDGDGRGHRPTPTMSSTSSPCI